MISRSEDPKLRARLRVLAVNTHNSVEIVDRWTTPSGSTYSRARLDLRPLLEQIQRDEALAEPLRQQLVDAVHRALKPRVSALGTK